jgi:hypothetical protein
MGRPRGSEGMRCRLPPAAYLKMEKEASYSA